VDQYPKGIWERRRGRPTTAYDLAQGCDHHSIHLEVAGVSPAFYDVAEMT